MLNDKQTPSILDRLEYVGDISPDGKDWLTAALDPFHDFQTRVRGMPDLDTSAVVVEKVKQTLSVSAPSGIGTALWDAHIFNLPIGLSENLTAGQYNDFQQFNYGYVTPLFAGTSDNNATVYQPCAFGQTALNTFTGNYGMINVVSVNSGSDTVPSNGTIPTNYQLQTINPPANLAGGKRRLIALGFEIHDTTAQLSQQGTATCYRMPNAETSQEIVSCDSTALTAWSLAASTSGMPTSRPDPAYHKAYQLPPATSKAAMAYTNSRQWHVKDGEYVVCLMDTERNALKNNEKMLTLFTHGDCFGTTSTADSNYALFTKEFTSNGVSTAYENTKSTVQTHFGVPFHTSGVFLTGLSSTSTFTVTVVSYWEYAPSVSEASGSALVYLAQCSSDYDPIALELYERASRLLPVAVPANMNAEGDFWDWVLGTVASVAPAIGNLLLPGAGGAVGSAVSSGLRSVQSNRNKKDAEEASLRKGALKKMDIQVPDTTNFQPSRTLKVSKQPKSRARQSAQPVMPKKQGGK